MLGVSARLLCLTTRHHDETSPDESSETDSASTLPLAQEGSPHALTLLCAQGKSQITSKKNQCIGKSGTEHGFTYHSSPSIVAPKADGLLLSLHAYPFSHVHDFSLIFARLFSLVTTDTAVSTEPSSPNQFSFFCLVQTQF